jgi:hypothetical protein
MYTPSYTNTRSSVICYVGKVGYAPTPLVFQTNASTKLASTPFVKCAIGRNRTYSPIRERFYRPSCLSNCTAMAINMSLSTSVTPLFMEFFRLSTTLLFPISIEIVLNYHRSGRGTRTPNIFHVKEALFQLSYSTNFWLTICQITFSLSKERWVNDGLRSHYL